MRMLRFLLRKFWLVLVLFALLTWLRQATAPISDTVSTWISGAREQRITQAFGEMLDSLSQGNGVKHSVEVFCEGLQG